MSEDCPLCCEPYTECKRAEIICPHCDKSCCSECFKNYFLKGDELNLKCPFDCDHTYNPSQIHKINKNNMSFFRKLLERLTKTNIIYEESLLIKTQGAAKYEKDWRDFREFRKKEKAEIAKLRELAKAKSDNLWRMEMQLYDGGRNLNEDKNEYTFIKECSHDGCRGKLNSQWKCVLCEKYTCSRCHMPKKDRNDPDHVCDEDIVKNLETLKQESRPCPKCGTAISKIDGCDQMYCVSCHTAFSWRTGKVENGYIHNPEYFRYRRENGLDIARNPMDRPDGIDECFDPFENYQERLYFEDLLRRITVIAGQDRRRILEIFRFGMHIQRMDLPYYNNNFEEKKRNLRVKYLLGDFDKEKWYCNLKKITKENYFNNEVMEILTTLKDIIKDIITNIVVKMTEDIHNYCGTHVTEQLEHFAHWYNKQNHALYNCGIAYGSKKILHYEYNYDRFINSSVRGIKDLIFKN